MKRREAARPSTTVVERFERPSAANCALLGGVVDDVGERAQSRVLRAHSTRGLLIFGSQHLSPQIWRSRRMQSLRGRPWPTLTASPGADIDAKTIVMLNFDRRVPPGSVGFVYQSADAHRMDARKKPGRSSDSELVMAAATAVPQVQINCT